MLKKRITAMGPGQVQDWLFEMGEEFVDMGMPAPMPPVAQNPVEHAVVIAPPPTATQILPTTGSLNVPAFQLHLQAATGANQGDADLDSSQSVSTVANSQSIHNANSVPTSPAYSIN
jgi:hypothetical protein